MLLSLKAPDNVTTPVWCRWGPGLAPLSALWAPCLLRVFVPPVVLCLAPVSRTPVLARITSPLITQSACADEAQSQHSINHQHQPCPDHSDNDNAFWPFCRIFSCFQCYFGGEQIDIRRSRHLHILSFLTAWNPKYCVYLTIRQCWTRGEMSYVTPNGQKLDISNVTPVTSERHGPQWPGWQSESDINDSTFDELDFIKTRMERLKREH